MFRPLLVGLLILTAVGAAQAQTDATMTADQVLEKVYDQLYSPKAAGLKDVKFQLSSPMLDPMLGGGKMVFYWKADPTATKDKSIMKIEGAAADNPMLEGMVKNISKGFVALFSGEAQKGSKQYDAYMKHSTRSLDAEGDNYVLTIKRNEDAPADLEALRDAVMTVDKKTFRITKVKTAVQQQEVAIVVGYKEVDVDGKKKLILISQKMPMAQMGGDVEAVTDWAKVDGIWVPQKMTQKIVAQGMEIVMEFKDMQVNKGIDDSVFAK